LLSFACAPRCVAPFHAEHFDVRCGAPSVSEMNQLFVR